jgi:hypothetical protein
MAAGPQQQQAARPTGPLGTGPLGTGRLGTGRLGGVRRRPNRISPRPGPSRSPR